MFGRREIKIETPPKGVIIVWIVIALELLFDLITTSFGFKAFLLEPSSCCGEQIGNGSILSFAPFPFAILVVVELGFLFRAIRLTMWPANMTEEELDRNRSFISKLFFGSDPGVVIFVINILTVFNLFLGFCVTWMLIYLSNEQEAYIVIGMESVAVLMHLCIMKGQQKPSY